MKLKTKLIHWRLHNSTTGVSHLANRFIIAQNWMETWKCYCGLAIIPAIALWTLSIDQWYHLQHFIYIWAVSNCHQ